MNISAIIGFISFIIFSIFQIVTKKMIGLCNVFRVILLATLAVIIGFIWKEEIISLKTWIIIITIFLLSLAIFIFLSIKIKNKLKL